MPTFGGSSGVGASVSTTEIDDNAVTGAKIAMGSDAQGDVLYYNGTDYVRLPAGTSGQFLKTQGAGANPAWAANASGVIFLAAASPSAAANVDFTSLSGYEHYLVIGHLSSSNVTEDNLGLILNNDSGTDYSHKYLGITGTYTEEASQTKFIFSSAKSDIATEFAVLIGTTPQGSANVHGIAIFCGQSMDSIRGLGGHYVGVAATDITRVTISFASGTCTGEVSIFGIANV